MVDFLLMICYNCFMENFGDFRSYKLLSGKTLEVDGFGSFRDEFILYWDIFVESLEKFGSEIRKLSSNNLEEKIGFIRDKLRMIKRSLNATLNECHSSAVVNCATSVKFRASQIKKDNLKWFEFFQEMVVENKLSYELMESGKNLCSLLDEIAWRMEEFAKRCRIKKSK